ncbi:MAG: hypothetical protein DIU78_014835 [Pseudomonadota bacterium]
MRASREAFYVAAFAVLASQAIAGCLENDADDLFGGSAGTVGSSADGGATGGSAAEGGTGGATESPDACAPGQERCAGECVTLENDPEHCGSCGNACDADEVCSAGECQLDCVGGTTACDRSCVDTDLDPDNCGACGNTCGEGLVCSRGDCKSACARGLTFCDGNGAATGRCTDTRRDRENCGKCGKACDAGYVCNNGRCALSCQAGLVNCDGTCIDPLRDNDHCGASRDCADPGVACPSGTVCSAGTCSLSCPDPLVKCGDVCIDPNSNRMHCGATEGCGEGRGGAGEVCDPGEICEAGECVLSCPSPLIVCNGTCVDPESDRNYCGASDGCGNDMGDAGDVCADGEICVDGTCVLSCPDTLVACGGSCVDPDSSPDYCGASGDCEGANAGVACDADEACVAGQCQKLVTALHENCREYAGAIWCVYDDFEEGRSCTETCQHAGMTVSDDTSVVESIDSESECGALLDAFSTDALPVEVVDDSDVCAGIVAGSTLFCSSSPDCVVAAPSQPGHADVRQICPCQ